MNGEFGLKRGAGPGLGTAPGLGLGSGDAGEGVRPEVFHSLGVTVALAALVLWTVLEVARRARERAVRRRGAGLAVAGTWPSAGRLSATVPRSSAAWMSTLRSPVVRWLGGGALLGAPAGSRAGAWAVPLGVLAAAYVLIGGVPGAGVGLAAAYGAGRWVRRREPRRARSDAETVDPELPLAADLLAACLSAGAGPREAAGAVGESLDGPVGRRLAQIAAELRLGGEPAEAWGRLGEIPGAAGLARCLERAASSGAPAAGPVGRVAERCRAERARTTATRVRRAGVLITGPLGLCFLPAFLAAGVAPVVIGLAGGLLRR
ncbi:MULTISPECIES: type II secretion system F family protein [unclassified Streptomyces]|uniref:type II secretion system F family protein n=1 Tax=unclassified Streptomyces TaxID=2593676 RepID=UPI0033E05354